MLILIVAGGPEKGRTFELTDSTQVVLGREGSPFRIDDPKCSRQHARLWCQDDQWYLEDTQSRHGTYRNHKPIDGKTPVNDGDYIQIGSTVLVMASVQAISVERSMLLGPPEISPEATPEATPEVSLEVSPATTTTPDISQKIVTETAAAQPTAEAVASPMPASSTPPVMRNLTPPAHRPRAWGRTALVAGSSLAAAAAVIAVTVGVHLLDRRESAQKNAQLMRQLAALEDAPRRAQAQQKKTLESALARIDDRLAGQTRDLRSRDQVLGDILAAVREPAAITAKLDTVLAKIDALPDHGQQISALATAVAQMPDAQDQLGALAAAIQAQPRYDDQLAELAQAVAALPDARMPEALGAQLAALTRTSTDNAATLDQLQTRIDAGLRADSQAVMARIDQTLAQVLGQLEQQRDGDPGTDAVLMALTRNQKHVDALLGEVLVELETRPTSETLITQLRTELAAAVGQPSPRTEALFAQLTAEIRRQPSMADLGSQIVAAQQPGHTATADLLDQILTHVQAQDTITEQLGELKALVQADVQADVQANSGDAIAPILDQMLARLRALDRPSDATADNTQVLAAITELRQSLARNTALAQAAPPSLPSAAPRSVAPDAPTGEAVPADDDGLTETERAYRLAFETGQTVRLRTSVPGARGATAGADPGIGRAGAISGRNFGETSGGGVRVLDPAAARAAGMTDWRDWYMMDDFSERMRLQKQAMRYLKDNAAASETTRLPSRPSTVISASPAAID